METCSVHKILRKNCFLSKMTAFRSIVHFGSGPGHVGRFVARECVIRKLYGIIYVNGEVTCGTKALTFIQKKYLRSVWRPDNTKHSKQYKTPSCQSNHSLLITFSRHSIYNVCGVPFDPQTLNTYIFKYYNHNHLY